VSRDSDVERGPRHLVWLNKTPEENVTVHGVRTSQVPRGGEMVPPHLNQHLLHLSRS
jgi:hypothetical protein